VTLKKTGLNKFLKKLICAIFVFCFATTTTFAQSASETSTTKSGPRKQLSIIFLSGLSGAVLGLSTLSFYGRPQDHMSNIAMGFALGVVFGTIYVTYNTAKRPKEYLSETPPEYKFAPITTSRGFLDTPKKSNLVSYSWSF
jgi:hypothetical protein